MTHMVLPTAVIVREAFPRVFSVGVGHFGRRFSVAKILLQAPRVNRRQLRMYKSLQVPARNEQVLVTMAAHGRDVNALPRS